MLLLLCAGDDGNLSEVEVAVIECSRKNLGMMYLSDLYKDLQLQILSFVHDIVINKKFIEAWTHLFKIRELFPTGEDVSNCLVILRNFSDQRSRNRWRERKNRRGDSEL